jgi:membrane-associated phospholipid phosphatase
MSKYSLFVWILLFVETAALMAAIHISGFVIERDALTALVAATVVGAGGLAFQFIGIKRIGTGCEILSQLTLCAIITPLLSVVLAASALPYRDAELAAIDRMIFGLDWLTMARAAIDWPLLSKALSYAYASIMQQPQVLLLVLVVVNQLDRARTFICAWTIALLITVAVFPFVPALGGYLHYGIKPGEVPSILVQAAWLHVDILGAARDGTLTSLSAKTMEGIITFPSFHTAAAVLLAWSFWGVPYLRWAAAALNVVMIISTPLVGGHYFVDVLAGILMAWAAIKIAGHLSSVFSGSLMPVRSQVLVPGE